MTLTAVGPALLDNPIRTYPWGSRTALADLLGTPPSRVPQAELWMGAHPVAPSRIAGRSVLDLIREAPEDLLGERFAARGLPFLLKVLAVAHPLSIQAHPDDDRARAGFAREESRGLALDAAERCYRDRHGKPELLVALTPFEALCGLRADADRDRVFAALGLWPDLRDCPVGSVLGTLLAQPERVTEAVAACRRPGPLPDERALILALHHRFPRDVGVACALLLRPIRMAPGQSLAVRPGVLHCYLRGVGVEVQASSDNVVRAGLTDKHVDAAELMRIARLAPGGPTPRSPVRAGVELRYACPDAPFHLSRIELQGRWVSPDHDAPEIVLCTDGRVVLAAGSTNLVLDRGRSALVPAASKPYVLSGTGTVFRATAA